MDLWIFEWALLSDFFQQSFSTKGRQIWMIKHSSIQNVLLLHTVTKQS